MKVFLFIAFAIFLLFTIVDVISNHTKEKAIKNGENTIDALKNMDDKKYYVSFALSSVIYPILIMIVFFIAFANT